MPCTEVARYTSLTGVAGSAVSGVSAVSSWSAVLRSMRAAVPLILEARTDLLRLRAPPGPGEPYGRLPLHRDAEGEVMLAGWTAAECAPHDHAGGEGLVCILDGAFTETEWLWRDGGLERGACRRWSAGDAIPVAPGTIHSMIAHDAGTTLHLYRPAISGMRVFDPARRETLLVRDDCGAWVPRDEGLVLSRTSWPAAR